MTHQDALPKLCGSDVELANFILGARTHNTCRPAAQLLLGEFEGVWHASWSRKFSRGGGFSSSGQSQFNAQDWGRKFLPNNGGCAYIDLDHLELPLPEVRSARDYVAAWHAMLRLARDAMSSAAEKLEPGLRLQVLANNSDGLGHSYGSHLNVLISRRAFDNIFHRKLHHMLYLAAYQVSSIIFTGQGKVGSENDRPAVDYQIAQRADFFETLTGLQTTYNRPLVNSRNEALCGTFGRRRGWRRDDELARLHVIFYDSNLCHVASYLKMGVLQIILAMIEQDRVNPTLLLDDPVEAVLRYSHDPELQRRAPLAGGEQLTAAELQLRFFDEAQKFVADGRCKGIVTEAEEILRTWGDVLEKLRTRRFDELAGSLDWVLKRHLLERALGGRPGLTWQSPELKHLDHLYSSIDPDDGLYWACERSGVAETLVSDADIERLVHEPPEDTRAWGRAMLLRLAGDEGVSYVDWDEIRFELPGPYGWPTYRTLPMPDPLGMTKADLEHLLDGGRTLEEVLEALSTCDGSAFASSFKGGASLHYSDDETLPAASSTRSDQGKAAPPAKIEPNG